MLNRRAILGFLAATPLALLGRAASARQPAFYCVEGLALGGFDPVAYFRHAAPVAGDPAHMLMWRGAIWQFSSAHTMNAFEMNPEAFAPQFGGYCALALANGHLGPSDPATWRIYQGRLYLIHNTAALTAWSTDIDANLDLAATHWSTALHS